MHQTWNNLPLAFLLCEISQCHILHPLSIDVGGNVHFHVPRRRTPARVTLHISTPAPLLSQTVAHPVDSAEGTELPRLGLFHLLFETICYRQLHCFALYDVVRSVEQTLPSLRRPVLPTTKMEWEADFLKWPEKMPHPNPQNLWDDERLLPWLCYATGHSSRKDREIVHVGLI